MAANYGVLSSGTYSIPYASVLAKLVGTSKWILLGDVDSFSLTIEPQRQDRYGKDGSTRTLRASVVTQVDSTVSFKAMQWTSFIRALSVMGTATTQAQASATGQTHMIADVEAGGIYQLPHYQVSVTSATDGSGTPVAYTAGTHYELVDADLGMIKVIAIPGGAGSDLVITYDAAAIDATDDLMQAEIASDVDIRGELIVRGLSESGPREVLHLHDVQFAPSGERPFISGDDSFTGLDITGKALKSAVTGKIGMLMTAAA